MTITVGRVCQTSEKQHVLLTAKEEDGFTAIDMHTGKILHHVRPSEVLSANVATYMTAIIQASLYHGGQLVLQKDEAAAVAEALASRLKFEESPLLLTSLQKLQANQDIVARRDFYRLQKTLEKAGEKS